MQELRCDHIKFGELDTEAETLEVKCRSSLCGAKKGVVVLHEFDVVTGKLVSTSVFAEPTSTRQGG